jgi:uncharacterized repeat protein (TIGR01451 family)
MTAWAFLALALGMSRDLAASSSLQNYTGGNCGAPGASITIQFQIESAAWQTAYYAVAFSSNTTPDSGDTWVAGNCSSGSGVATTAQGGTPAWQTITISTTVPAGFTTGYILILAKESYMNCSPDQQMSIPFLGACGSPTITPTTSPTPSVTPTFSVSPTPSVTKTMTPTPWPTAAGPQISNLVVSSCGLPGSNITVTFNVRTVAYNSVFWKVAFSSSTTPSSASDWVVTSGGYYSGGGLASPSHNCGDGGPSQSEGSDSTVWYPETYSLTVPASYVSSFYVVVVAQTSYINDCLGGTQLASTLIPIVCGTLTSTPTLTPTPTITPTFTVTPTFSFSPTQSNSPVASNTFTVSPTLTDTRTISPSPTGTPSRTVSPTPSITQTSTPAYTATISATLTNTPNSTATITPTPIVVPMVKSVGVASATIGDTVTYCIAWQNNSGGSYNVVIWDTLSIALTYVGSNSGGTYSPRMVVWNLGSQGNGANGTVCFWGVVSGYPYLPPQGDLLAWLMNGPGTAWRRPEGAEELP